MLIASLKSTRKGFVDSRKKGTPHKIASVNWTFRQIDRNAATADQE